jgi:hypothetical protein
MLINHYYSSYSALSQDDPPNTKQKNPKKSKDRTWRTSNLKLQTSNISKRRRRKIPNPSPQFPIPISTLPFRYLSSVIGCRSSVILIFTTINDNHEENLFTELGVIDAPQRNCPKG